MYLYGEGDKGSNKSPRISEPLWLFLGLWISCCSGFALHSFDQGLNLSFSMCKGGGKGPASVCMKGWVLEGGIWPDVVLIARELRMAFLRLWLTTPPQPGALSSSKQNLRCSLTLSVLPLGPQPPVNTLWAHLYIVSLPILVHVTHWPASSWRAKNAPISASMGSPWFPHSRAQEMLAEWIMKGKRFECEDAYPLFR